MMMVRKIIPLRITIITLIMMMVMKIIPLRYITPIINNNNNKGDKAES